MRTFSILDPCLVSLGSCPLTEEGARNDYGYVCGSSQRSSYTGPIGYRLSFVEILVKRHRVLPSKLGKFALAKPAIAGQIG